MTIEPRHKKYGYTLSEAIDFIPGDLDRDATGLWHIIPIGRSGFGLEGVALVEFVRRAIHALIDAGAVAVSTGKGTEYEWIVQKQYGKAKEEIAEAVIQEWLQEADDPSKLYKVWFARPDPAHPNYVKLD